MHKILEMGEMGFTNALYICDRQTCRNTWEGHPNERVNIGNRDFDLCQECLDELGQWFGEVPWNMADHPGRKIRYDALPRAREMLSQVGEMLNWIETPAAVAWLSDRVETSVRSGPAEQTQVSTDTGDHVAEGRAQAWDDGFEAGVEWTPSGPSGIPSDPPLNPYQEGVAQDDETTESGETAGPAKSARRKK